MFARIQRRLGMGLLGIGLVIGVALSEVSTAGAQTARIDIEPIPPVRDCSVCEQKLERTTKALAQAQAKNERLKNRVKRLRQRLLACGRDQRACQRDLERAKNAVSECRQDFAGCTKRLGQCREDLADCRGDQCCDPAQEPGVDGKPICFEGASCCDDGGWRCNEADGSSSCDGPLGEVCEACCDPALEPGTNGQPFCFEGATCCSDGSFRCNQADGSPSCDGPVGVVCEQPMACDPRLEPGVGEVPICFEGATCCADGIWRCNIGVGGSGCLIGVKAPAILESVGP